MTLRHEVVMGGFGGQGVKSIASLLGRSADKAGLHAMMYNLYGAAIRGGAIFCNIVIGDEPLVGAPTTTHPTALLAMDANTADVYLPLVVTGGTAVLNTSLVTAPPERGDVRTIRVPASEIAEEIGDFKLSGMVALGALAADIGVVDIDTIADCLAATLKPGRHYLLEANRVALARGAELAARAPHAVGRPV